MKGSASAHRKLIVSIFLLLLFASASSETAIFAPKTRQGHQTNEIHSTREEDFSNLMGREMEECKKEDEGCMDTRMVAEAHLDYIYTQKHQHP